MELKTVFEALDAKFEVDRENSLLVFTWMGEVSENSVKTILSRAAGASSLMNKAHWLINRRHLQGYTPEARIWIKNHFIDDIGKDLIIRTDKIAALNSESPLAEISAGVLIEALTSINPDIQYKQFDLQKPAINWLMADDIPESKTTKKKGFFRRKL